MDEQEEKFKIPAEIERYLETLSNYYANENNILLQKILVNSVVSVEAGWTYDNWDGGIYGHAVYLTIPGPLYLKIVDQKTEIESQINEGLGKINDVEGEFFAKVFLKSKRSEDHDWRNKSGLLMTPGKIIPEPIINRIWDDECFRLFISHKSTVKKETAQLKEELRLFGIDSFVAHEDIHPTKEWVDEIESALHTMEALLALMAGDFHGSYWTDQEVGFAFGRDVPIIAVKLDEDPNGFLGRFQALSCSWDNAAVEIAKILIENESMLNAYINAVRKSEIYEDSNKLAELLPCINNLSDLQTDTLIRAFNENSQVRDSFGFNGQKPSTYGRGLAYLLNRIKDTEYKISAGRGITQI